MAFFKEELLNVKAFAFDVDGVFAKSNFYLHHSGDMMRSMNIKDGYAVQLAIKKKYPIAIITGGNSQSVKSRFNNLGVTDIYLNSFNKLDNFITFYSQYNIKPENILYMGDDIPDYEVMKKTGIPTCPIDAAEDIKNISKYISDKKGGEGCVRDVIEQVLRAQNKWLDGASFNW